MKRRSTKVMALILLCVLTFMGCEKVLGEDSALSGGGTNSETIVSDSDDSSDFSEETADSENDDERSVNGNECVISIDGKVVKVGGKEVIYEQEKPETITAELLLAVEAALESGSDIIIDGQNGDTNVYEVVEMILRAAGVPYKEMGS